MRHSSVKLNTPCEFINITEINPLISKCQIKVCYVGDDPNRNGSIITKEVAADLAQTLPGSPIVGYFNEETADFGEHERELEIKENKLVLKDITKPYGFVDTHAKCWFQWFLDDNRVEREYLMTEGYIWTGQYPESERIIELGNNQSMELDPKNTIGSWTKDENGRPQFFIINESIISKLCILGVNEEPCFEGATITSVQFSLEDDFKQELFSMMDRIQELLSKGGNKTVYTEYAVTVGDSLWTALYTELASKEADYAIKAVLTEDETNFAIVESEGVLYRADFTFEEEALVLSDLVEFTDTENLPSETQFSTEDIEHFISEFEKEEDEQEICPKCGKPVDECECEDEEEKKFSLEDYEALSARYEELESSFKALNDEIVGLRQFKLEAERKEKEAMINNFYMLSDEDKEDVVANIDTYSLDEIESKLSVICVRNKVSFNLEKEEEEQELNFSLTDEPDSTPAWIKAVQETQKSL